MHASTAIAAARRVGGDKEPGISLSLRAALSNDLAITARLPRFAE
jgi:hypothetical protein